MSGNLKVFKDKVALYGKLKKIVQTVKTVTMAKYMKQQERLPVRDAAIVFSKKAFFNPVLMKPLLENESTLYVPITTNRGSCGALNSKINGYITSRVEAGEQLTVLSYGRKGNDSLSRLIPDQLSRAAIIDSIPGWTTATFIAENALTYNYGRCRILFNRFQSAAQQQMSEFSFLSFPKWQEAMVTKSMDGDIEGELTQDNISNIRFYNAVLSMDEETQKDFYDFHLAVNICHAIEENALSELAARMNAVENQLQNISKLRDWAQSVYNKTRQAGVTAEMLELVNAKSSIDEMMANEAKRAAEALGGDVSEENAVRPLDPFAHKKKKVAAPKVVEVEEPARATTAEGNAN